MRADQHQPEELSFCQSVALVLIQLKRQLQLDYEQHIRICATSFPESSIRKRRSFAVPVSASSLSTVNIRNYTSAMVTRAEIIESLSSLST